jgi:DnaB-like helicase C terminal domain
MGKSQLLINLALNMLAQSKFVLFHSLVLSESQMASRFLSSITTIPFIKVLMNNLTKTEKDILEQESTRLENYKMKLIDNSSSTLDWIAFYQNQIGENDLEVIFIDDLNELFENKTKKELVIFTNSLIKLAEKHNVCIIASTQISKKMEARYGEMKPRLSELIINDNLVQYSGKIISLYRPEYYGITSDESGYSVKNLAEILLLKNKSGSTGEVLIKRDENFTNFKDLASNKKEVHPSIDVQNIVENSNPAKNWANLGYLESQINNLNTECNREEILSEIGLIAPEKLGNDVSQANAIQYFIQKMDIEMIETFLVRNFKFERLGRNEFLKRLDKVFRNMKSFGDTFLYASPGRCNNCDTSKKGFQFIGNTSGYYINLLFIIEHDKVIELEECTNLFTHTREIRLNNRILIGEDSPF